MKIICIGRNYAKHAKEMNAAVPTTPLFFMKPDVALLRPGTPFFYPNFSKDIHFECELVVKNQPCWKKYRCQICTQIL
jgi:2-keto-4-pentenoate hydratase/2-oxohepta-3-ene-1,7-dioic acid hydratase in catechol pathway